MGTETVAQRFAASLRRHGVTHVFGQSIPSALILACSERGIRQITYRTENAGGAMADGYARISHRVSVVTAQNGPAATLLVAPLAEALKASVPMVAIVQDVPAASRDRNAFQELDHFELFRSCAKWVRRIDDGERVDDYVDQAFIAATSGRPGPAVLLAAKDVLAAEISTPPVRRGSYGRYPLDRPTVTRDKVRQLVDRIRRARRPLIVAGGGVHASGAHRELAALQAAAAVPVATTPMGKGAVDESDPLSLGVVGYAMGVGSASRNARAVIDQADLIVFVGSRTNENGTDGWRLFPAAADYVHIDVDPGEIGRNYEAERYVGDARSILADVVDELRSHRLDPDDLERRRREVGEALAAAAGGERPYDALGRVSPVRPETLMRELDRLLPDDAIVVADASYSSVWMANGLGARTAGQRFLSPRGLAGLGWGFPMALGAKAARPDAPVVAIVGDGGFGHCWQELETAVRSGLPIVLVVLNNGILGYQKHSELYQFGRHTDSIEFGAVDHAAIADASGAKGLRVSTSEEIAPRFVEAMRSGTMCVLDVTVEADAWPPITAWDGDPLLASLSNPTKDAESR